MPTLETAIEEFVLAGQQVGWTRGTCQTYTWHLTRFRLWMTDHTAHTAHDLTRLQVRRWGAELRDRWAPATCKGAVTAIRAFLHWLHEENYTEADLTSALHTPKIPRTLQRTISPGEVEKLLLACEHPTERGLLQTDALAVAIRNAALVGLLYDSLIRARELCNLTLADLDLDARRVIIHRGKGGHDRTSLFSPATADLLRAWLQQRAHRATCTALFVAIAGHRPGRELTTRGLRIIIKRLGERAGVLDLSPHAFRRGGAVSFTLNGAPGRIVMQIAGWSSQRMLETYTRAIADADITAAFDRYSPVTALHDPARNHTPTGP